MILSVSTYRCDTLYTNVHCKSAGKELAVGRGVTHKDAPLLL